MASLQFLQLPIDPDQGLPQSVTFSAGANSYVATVYASISSTRAEPLARLYDLSSPINNPNPESPPGYIVLKIDRRTPGGPVTLLLRKLIPEAGLVHYAHELAVMCKQVVVARGNLNAAGRYGSKIVIGVAVRWA